MENKELFRIENVNEAIAFLEKKVVAPYVKATYSTLGGKNNVSIMLTISMESKNEWLGGLLTNTDYAIFHISHDGVLERFSGSMRKMKSKKVESLDELSSGINDYILGKEKYNLGGGIQDEEVKQIKYKPASTSGPSINTFVPASMYAELNSFYDYLKSYILEKYNMTIEQFVAFKLHYNSVDDLFYSDELDDLGNRKGRFAKEQIDAIATAIYNAEANNQGIIIADQTGVGKGRTAAGLIRYAIEEAKVKPLFATDKKHLIIDIYRDLIDIGYEANIPIAKRTKTITQKDEYTDEEIIELIKQDLKDTDDVRVDYEFPKDDEEEPDDDDSKKKKKKEQKQNQEEDSEVVKFSISKLKNFPNRKKFSEREYEYYEEIMEEIIEMYRQYLVENGLEEITDAPVPQTTIERMEKEALAKGKRRIFPFIPSMFDIENQNGDLLYKKLNRNELNRIYGFKKDAKGKYTEYDYENPPSSEDLYLPEPYLLIAAPYTQLRKETEEIGGRFFVSFKFRFFQSALKDSILVLDEAHNAAGGSATFRVISRLISLSKMCVFLSATYAKRPDNMPLYAKKTSISEARLSDAELIQVFKSGETALQEAVSVELTRNGQILRRDKQISGETNYFYVYDDENEFDGKRLGTQQRARLDRVAMLFKKVTDFQKEISGFISTYKKGLPERNPFMGIEGTKQEIAKARTIKALSFQLFNFFLIGIKIDQTMYEAKRKMTNGRKLVFAIANTMESALKNMPKTFYTNKPDFKYKIGDEIANDFKLYIAYMLFYTMRFKLVKETVSDTGEIVQSESTECVFDSTHDLASEILSEFRGKYDTLLQEILDTDTYISISPIDTLIKNINGFKDSDDYVHSIEEITGRTLKLQFIDDEMRVGKIVKRQSRPTTKVVKDFNTNEIDHLIINQSGAVGISMHPRPVGRSKVYYPTTKEEYIEEGTGSNKKREVGFPLTLGNKDEVKKRCMIILQMELDISKEVQKLGRISRTGQVYEPEYIYVISAIPSESRLTAMMERKLRSLSANTSGNQKQSSELFEQEDFFGEVAVNPFKDTIRALNLWGLLGSLGVSFDSVTKEHIKEFTKLLYFIDFETQLKFYTTFSDYLNEEIKRQTSVGLYVGKLGYRDFKSENKLKLPFFIGNENSLTSFGRHAFIEKVDADVPIEKTGERDINELYDIFLKNVSFGYILESFNNVEEYKSGIGSHIETLYQEVLGRLKSEITDLEQNIGYYETIINRAKKDLDTLSKILPDVSQALENERLTKEEFEKINSEFVKAKDEDDFDTATKLKPLKEKAQDDYNKAKEVINKLTYTLGDGDVVLPQDVEKNISRIESKIKRNERDINDDREKIVRTNEEIADKTRLYELVKMYSNNSGAVVIHTELEESDIYEDVEEVNELGEKVVNSVLKEYKYDKKDSKYAVIFGVSFKERNLTASNIILNFGTLTNSSTQRVPLSQINPSLSVREKQLGKKGVNEFSEPKAPSFKNYWDEEIVKKEKSTARQTRWILTGSVLRAFKSGLDSNFRMELSKYTTKDRKYKLGCIISNLRPDEKSPSVYEEFELKYNSDRDYCILYEGSIYNVMSFMIGKMYNYYIEKYYEIATSGNKDSMINKWDIQNEFIFQISTSRGASFVEIKVSSEIKQMARLLWDNVDSNSLIDSDGNEAIPKMTDEEFMSKIAHVKIISDEISITDAFAVAAISKNQDFSYTTQKKSYVTDKHVKEKDNYIFGWDMSWSFNTFFPINESVSRDFIAARKRSMISTNVLTLYSIQSFLDCISWFEELNSLPTFGVSNRYFQKFASMYSFDDTIDKASNPVEPPSEPENEISKLIDELSKLI